MKSNVRFVFPEFFKPKDLDKYDVETFTNLEEGLTDADIVMMLRIQNERILDMKLPSKESYFEKYPFSNSKKIFWEDCPWKQKFYSLKPPFIHKYNGNSKHCLVDFHND